MNPLRLANRAVRGTLRRVDRAIGPALYGSICPVCGQSSVVRGGGVFPADLADAWKLSPDWQKRFVDRECYTCIRCTASARTRHFATVLVSTFNRRFNLNAGNLVQLCEAPEMQRLDVAEINSVGQMHPALARLPKLRYSEFQSKDPAVPHEDLLNLSYADASFDLALTSETLEHVPDVRRALSEIRRILRPGGMHIFTVPIIWDRPSTLQRSSIVDGQLVHHHRPSFHGDDKAKASDFLVFYEYGADFPETVRSAGFELDVIRDNDNPALSVFVTIRSTD